MNKSALSLVPRPLPSQEEAWYTLLAHVHNTQFYYFYTIVPLFFECFSLVYSLKSHPTLYPMEGGLYHIFTACVILWVHIEVFITKRSLGIRKIVYSYGTSVMDTYRACLFHLNKGLQLCAICCLLSLYHAPFLL